ncbi:GNAT family N-acetyltransferase [Rhizobium mongolense]|uniref:GNAT family N-acetyltransferase n=1 Tax=Rhizobium mongolense TaxID=57676 RepID=UPI0035578B43
MISDSQSLSLPRNVQLPRVTFRRPTEIHAADVWELIAKCPVLAERAGAVVGWLSAYRRPSDLSTLFIWQIALHLKIRKTGVGKGLIMSALNRPSCESVTHIEATVTFSNRASKLLFAGVARNLRAPIRQAVRFDRDIHFKGQHESEYTIALRPLRTLHQPCGHARRPAKPIPK